MISVLHSAFFLIPHPGVIQQMEAEQVAAQSLGIQWQCAVFTVQPHTHAICINGDRTYANRFIGRLAYYRWLLKAIKSSDVLLLRHSLSDPLQVFFLWLLRRPAYLVHHTLEVPQVQMYKGRFTRLKTWIEMLAGRLSIAQAEGLICVTQEIAGYEQSRLARPKSKVHIYPNGVVFEDSVSVEEGSGPAGNDPATMVFAASSFIEWHGLDKVIAAARQSQREFVLHIVGVIDEPALLEAARQCDKVVLHGLLTTEELRKLETQCDIGLGSFALERKGMKEACPLKVRGSLKAGLPVYAGHPDIFPDDFPYYRQGPCDFDDITDFALQSRRAGRLEVAIAAKPFIDKRQLVSDLHEFLETQRTIAT